MRARVPAFLLLTPLCLGAPAWAQGVGTLAVGSIQITPDGTTTPQHPANTMGYSQIFVVKNTYSTPMTIELICLGRVNVTCTDLDVSNMTLGPGQQMNTAATYSVGAAGTGRLVVQAVSHPDSGYYVVPVVNGSPPSIALRNHNGDNRDRSLCLTSGAGEAAAWQCGDLLVAHGLPGYATMGKERTLTLLYNSAQAVPRPVVAASVTQEGVAPNAVFVRLSINGVPKDSASYTGWASGTRQVAIPHDALADSSGIYPFTLLVRNIFGGTVLDATVSDTLIVVNRASSLYGAGWSLAGVEELRLNQAGNRIIWVGGDGSAKVYRNVGTNVWQAAAGGFRDTLRYDPATTAYTRTLRHGIQVNFDAAGRHIQTINRVGQTTTFTWSGSPLTLTSIQVPPGGTGTTYTLTYDGNGKLDKITDPAGRVLDATVVSNRLTQIVDPDTTTFYTSFAYDAVGRLTGRTNRRGFTTRYGYANGLRVTADSIPLDTAAVTYGITTFTPWDERGLAVAPSGNTAVDVALAYTKIDGPRPAAVGDTAEFWIDRWGAPVQIRDPLGSVTTLQRGSSTVPALVTRVASADGRIVGSDYDARGNVVWMADSTYDGVGSPQTVTTSYVYGDTRFPDSPTLVRAPVDTLAVTYDTLGLPSLYTAQGGHQTGFTYVPSGGKKGLLSAVTEYSVPVVDTTAWTEANVNLISSFDYDALGNLVWMQSPKALTTTYGRDAYTRVTQVRDPARHLTVYTYDKLNRVDTVTVYDDTLLNGPKKTRYRYTRTGLVDSLVDPRGVVRTWRYDAADRSIRETDDVGKHGYSYLSAAGLVDSTRTRNGHVIRHVYDAAGRLTQTIYPANTLMPNTSVPGDTILRAYDVVGRVRSVTSRNAIDSLWYNREGSIRMERQAQRNDSKIVQLLDTVRYWYDAGGRRTKFYNGVDTIRYSYGGDGQLAKLKVDWMQGGLAADSFLFTWDALGRRDRVQYTNGTDVTFGYDRDGQLRLVCSKHPGGDAGANDYLEQRVHYKQVDVDGQVIEMSRHQGVSEGSSCAATNGTLAELYTNGMYDGRHQLVSRSGLQNESYQYDGSGNITAKTIGVVSSTFALAPASNRLVSGTIGSLNYLYSHDTSGNRVQDIVPGAPTNTRKFYYNAIGQMVGDSAYWDTGTGFQWHGSLDMFRYDAQGRRVWLGGTPPGFYFAHDGANVVRSSYTFEWRYIHGPGVDDPLVAAYHPNAPWTEKYYYLTDGRGRQLAFTNPAGSNYQSSLEYTQNGGSQAGGITASNGFDNERSGAAAAPRLSFYRNRYYDQETGRWTQEDPIGIAGGVNLYQYAGNNPAAYTDPFGLRPDTVEVIGAQSKAAVSYMRSASTTFNETYEKLDKDPNVHLLIRDPHNQAEALGGAEVFAPGPDGHATILVNVVATNQANYDLLRANPHSSWVFTVGTDLAHELGHAAGHFGYAPRACAFDPRPGGTGCVLNFENKVRRELGPAGGGIRDRY